jgi:hypothetical protein
LEKRLKIGNKWSEIIKEMPGRTENNVKNRFNMMYKTVKDKHLMKLTHGSVFVMQEDEKMVKKSSSIDDYINEEALIQKLIKIK